MMLTKQKLRKNNGEVNEKKKNKKQANYWWGCKWYNHYIKLYEIPQKIKNMAQQSYSWVYIYIQR